MGYLFNTHVYFLPHIIMWYHYITIACSEGYFGGKCASTCGQCSNKKVCHHVTGNCIEGCLPGYKEPKCKAGSVYVYNI